MKEEILKEFKKYIATQKTNIINYIKRVGAYIRVSTDKQTELSPISQLKEIWKYCESHNYYLDLNYVFIEEEGISGKSANKRNEFQEMISIAKSNEKPFDIILVWKFSRFARNQEESIVYKQLLKRKHNIEVVSVSEPLPDGPFGGLIERIIEWFDEYYLINLSGEVTRGMEEKANKGEPLSIAPYGYDMKDSKLVINEKESAIIKFIFEKYSNNELTMLDIARYLNSLGYKTKRGNNFENRTIFYILLNPVYIGKIRWTTGEHLRREEMYDNTKSIISKGQHQPIVDEELFNKARERLSKQRKFSVPRERLISQPWGWLKALIRCDECGSTLIRSKDKLRCNGYNRGSCNQFTKIDIRESERLILEKLDYYIKNKAKINTVKKKIKKDNANEKEIIQRQLEQIDNRLERTKLAYQQEIDTLEEYKKNKEWILKDKSNLEKQLEKLNSNSNTDNDNIKNIIIENMKTVYNILIDDNIDNNRKYEVAHFLINKVVYEHETNELVLYFNEFTDLI